MPTETRSEEVASAIRGPAPSAGAWKDRPPGMPGAVPPPSVPLAFLVAAACGLVACGVVFILVRDAAASDPTAGTVVAAVHFGVLATLSMAVLGALHQFTPVVTGRPLLSVALARATFVTWLAAAWLIPLGILTRQLDVVESGGALAAVSITMLVVNVARPLSAKGKGAPVTGLRFAVTGFVVTASFGILYVADWTGNWFSLTGHVVLAHAVVGVFAWLGLTYVAVAEKLWPMFFLAHVPGRRRAGWVAVWAVPGGIALLTPGLFTSILPLACAGAAILAVGLGAHLTSLVAHIRYRRRKADLHLGFVVTSATWLFVGAALSLAGVLVVPGDRHTGIALIAGGIAAFAGWMLETIVGHVHKVVPFIMWSALRSRGVATGPAGKPLMFADLYNHTWAAVGYALVTSGIAAICVGLAASAPAATAVGGALFVATSLVVALNLSLSPLLVASRSRVISAARAGAPVAAGAGPAAGTGAIGA